MGKKICDICRADYDQHEIIKIDDFWAHNDCYAEGIADAKFQEAEDRYNGFYDDTPVDDGWSLEQRAYYENGAGGETHYIDRDGNLRKRDDV